MTDALLWHAVPAPSARKIARLAVQAKWAQPKLSRAAACRNHKPNCTAKRETVE
jgi:hypothetical protein